MESIALTARGLAVLLGINKDRIVGLTAVAVALFLGSWLGSLGLP